MYVQWIKGELREGKNNFIVCFLQTKLPLCYHHFMSPRRACNFVNLLGLGLCEKEILFRLYVCTMPRTTDAQRSLFSMVSQTFGLKQTNWADKFWGIWGIFGWTISTISPLSMGKWIWLFFLKKTLVFRPNTYIYPKYTPNSHHTYVVGVLCYPSQKILHRLLKREEKAITYFSHIFLFHFFFF